MKVFVLIIQRPLKVKTYTSLTALYEDNKDVLTLSKSTLDKYPFHQFDYANSKVIISRTHTLTTGDVRNSHNQQ